MKAVSVIALVLALVLFCNIAFADAITVNKNTFYQSDSNFSLTGDAAIKSMAFAHSLGNLTVDATVLSESTFDDVQSLIVKVDTTAAFSYTVLHNVTDKFPSDYHWHIVSDGTSKIGTYDFGGQIKKGGIIVQKSYDGSEWSTVYQNTNVFENHPSGIEKLYLASRNDINNGCYYRFIIAYKTERKVHDSHFLFFDTSKYDHRWHVEDYQIFLIGDEEMPESTSVSIEGTPNNPDLAGGLSSFGNQSLVNNNAALELARESFTGGVGDHGFAAENANMESALRQGNQVEYTGYNNVKNGPDYIFSNNEGIITQVQCKYYSTPSGTISACFENGQFRYYSDTNVPMTIEVPADQYAKCVKLMRNRIIHNQVPGVTDPNEAENIIRQGSVTYKQAVNLAKAGTIESLKYDMRSGCVSTLTAFGISAVVQYAVSRWSGEPIDKALKNSLYTSLRVGGNAFITSILSNQLTRTGLNSLLVPASQAVIKVIGPKAAAVIVNASRVGLKPIYGAAAMKSAARMIRGGAIVNTVSFLVFTIPDTVELFRGRISGKQMIKNTAKTVGGIAGGWGGALGGAALGTAIAPGVGTTIGGIVGGIAGGVGASIGINALGDLIAENDADEMLDILNMEFQNLTEEYLLNTDEATVVSDELQKLLDANKLKDMFASSDRHDFARKVIEPLISEETQKRISIALPDEDAIIDGLVETLEEIYDMDLDVEGE